MSDAKDSRWDGDLARSLLGRYRVTSGAGFELDRLASDDLPESVPNKHKAKAIPARGNWRMTSYGAVTWPLRRAA